MTLFYLLLCEIKSALILWVFFTTPESIHKAGRMNNRSVNHAYRQLVDVLIHPPEGDTRQPNYYH